MVARVHDGGEVEARRAARKARRKAEAELVPLPDNVAMYIAGRIKSNIRELEGSLIRLIAFASLTGRELTLELTQEILKNVIEQDARAVTIDSRLASASRRLRVSRAS